MGKVGLAIEGAVYIVTAGRTLWQLIRLKRPDERTADLPHAGDKPAI
ncbi:hypothetical protein [Sphingomonas sp. VDB2]